MRSDAVEIGEHIDVRGSRQGFKSEAVQIGSFRNQSILEAPMIVTVVNRALLDAEGAQSMEEAMRNSPGLTAMATPPFIAPTFMARGIQIQGRTNYRLDGTLPIISFTPIPMEDKEAVEVLKGASAIYYGFSTPSAMANFRMKRAGSRPVTDLTLTGDSQGSYGGGVDFGRQVGKDRQFGYRINVYGTHIVAPVDGIDGYRWLTSGAFDWRPTEKLQFKLDVEHYQQVMDNPGGLIVPSAVGAVNGVGGHIALPRIPRIYNRYAPINSPFDTAADNALGRIDYAIWRDWSLRLEGGLARDTRARSGPYVQNYNVVTGWGKESAYYEGDEVYYNVNARAEISGSFRTWFINHETVSGYTRNDQIQDNHPQITYATFDQNIYHPVQMDMRNMKVVSAKTAYGAENTDNGLYFMDKARMGKHVIVTGGFRYEIYKTLQMKDNSSYSLDRITPFGALNILPIKSLSLYASYIEGLESAGTAPNSASNSGSILPPSVSEQYEFGGKWDTGRGLLSVAYFHINHALAYTNTSGVYVTNGRAVHKGIEASYQGNITKEVSAQLSGTWIDAVQKNTGYDYEDNKKVLNVPKWAASAFVQYTPSFFPRLSVNAGVNYIGARPLDVQNLATIPGYAIMSAGASYRTKMGGHNIVFRANGNNITNARYWASGDDILFVGMGATAHFSATTSF